MDYRRNYQSGGTFFFTVVTYNRHNLFSNPQALSLFCQVFRQVKLENPFTLNAWVIIPDHMHMIWTLPDKDENYSKRWSKIKGNFTRLWLNKGGNELPITLGKIKDKRRGIWQPRFYEHTIRDEDDYRRHVEYIHYNPVSIMFRIDRVTGSSRVFMNMSNVVISQFNGDMERPNA